MTAPRVALLQPLSRERRVDWARLLADLRGTGMSLPEVAGWLGVGKSTLQGYMNEDLASEPAYWTGHCLVLLWRARCGGQLDGVPLRDAPLSVSRMLRAMR